MSGVHVGRGRPRLDGTLTMANALVGYASFEGDGDNITGLSVSLVDDNATVTFPGETHSSVVPWQSC